MKSRIEAFNPTYKNDGFDILLASLWHHYIFYNVDEEKYSNYIQILNNRVNLDTGSNTDVLNKSQSQDLLYNTITKDNTNTT